MVNLMIPLRASNLNIELSSFHLKIKPIFEIPVTPSLRSFRVSPRAAPGLLGRNPFVWPSLAWNSGATRLVDTRRCIPETPRLRETWHQMAADADYGFNSFLVWSVRDYPFGSSDPLTQGLPEWELQPLPNYYVSRSKPATITCKATPAVQIRFRCAGREVPLKDQTNRDMVDPRTGRKTLISSIQVIKDNVSDYFGEDGYWCQCAAVNNVQGTSMPQSVPSTRGLVEIAGLKRLFERNPRTERVQEGLPTQMECLPPEGKPLPTVFWLKDGVELNVQQDRNYIITSEGNLIINVARKNDTGNYTCGARNLASERHSKWAILTVFVNGGWTKWRPSSECSVSCGDGLQLWSRTCTEPAPYNDGLPCEGGKTEQRVCTRFCNGRCTMTRHRFVCSHSPYCEGCNFGSSFNSFHMLYVLLSCPSEFTLYILHPKCV
ncbi:netrin receptor unc5c [Plakobranchus ocellatus]|uniref:Netrin receptor unc5c n=1 Tax=Plakobranchus ocellatus TaxID=259542 RepID=A0AAV4BWW9_9GAST|nr:netrin receptor unc5c [Plakobranchus ocellatus]